ncbi:MAG: dihydrodipicolinate synthase family protein [Candidatus Bathyarchaeia archaeon]
MRLKGIIPPLVTPLDERERLDLRGIERQINRLVSGGVDGLFLLGSSGEFPALLDEDKITLVEMVADLVGTKLPVLVGATEPGTKRTELFIQKVKHFNIYGIVVAPPYYYPLSLKAVTEHYEYLSAKTETPIILYNIPQTTKIFIDAATIRMLAIRKSIAGVKDSSGNFSHFQQLLWQLIIDEDEHQRLVPVFQGEERLAAVSLLAGADGLVPAFANVAPKLYCALWRATQEKDFNTAMRLQQIINEAVNIYDYGSVYGSLKTALNILGVCNDVVTMPLQKPSVEERHLIVRLIERLDGENLL